LTKTSVFIAERNSTLLVSEDWPSCS